MGVMYLCFHISQIICSDLCEIQNFLDDIVLKLGDIIKDEILLFDIRLILSELIINSAIHGNKKDKCKKISVKLDVDKKSFRLEVTDEGNGFIFDKGAYDPLELKCSGRGLVIADGLSDEFYIDNNKVVSVKYF